MKVLVIAEQREGKLRKITFENLTLARQLGETFEVAVLGAEIHDLAEDLGKYGAEKIVYYKNEALAEYSADRDARLLSDIVKEQNADLVIMGATATGKDLAPRMAAHLDAALATDCTQITLENDTLKIIRPMYAGKVLAEVELDADIRMVTVRPNVYPATEQPVTPQIEEKAIDAGQAKAVVKELAVGEKGKLDVTEADIIVSGGRGLKGPENWHLVTDLAEAFGAAHGASRAVVDAGWRPHDEQVGQTGKTVSPSLYVAVGISGAIQHLAGMSSSKFIVAINKDEEAPIFKVADYGIVGDAFEVVPRMIEELKKNQ